MNSNLPLRRAKPQLGTIVEIEAAHAAPDLGQHAIEQAFAAIQEVDRLMSPLYPGSDIVSVNQAGAGQSIRIQPNTMQVLTFCDDLFQRSEGLFDPAILAHGSSWRDLQLADDCVYVKRPLKLDLGGVAKGFAVDQAIEVLMQHGCSSGIVNAGGDLRCFGAAARTVHIRNPEQPAQLLMLANLQNRALATSANLPRSADMSPRHPVRAGRQSIDWHGSVSVMAPTCMAADALTKFVIASGRTDHPLLASLDASSIWIGKSS